MVAGESSQLPAWTPSTCGLSRVLLCQLDVLQGLHAADPEVGHWPHFPGCYDFRVVDGVVRHGADSEPDSLLEDEVHPIQCYLFEFLDIGSLLLTQHCLAGLRQFVSRIVSGGRGYRAPRPLIGPYWRSGARIEAAVDSVDCARDQPGAPGGVALPVEFDLDVEFRQSCGGHSLSHLYHAAAGACPVVVYGKVVAQPMLGEQRLGAFAVERDVPAGIAVNLRVEGGVRVYVLRVSDPSLSTKNGVENSFAVNALRNSGSDVYGALPALRIVHPGNPGLGLVNHALKRVFGSRALCLPVVALEQNAARAANTLARANP